MIAPSLSGDQLSPDWSPDGAQIVFVNEDPATGRRSLYSFDLAGGTLSRLTENSQTNDILPQFSPDGARVLFISQWVQEGTKQIPGTVRVLDLASGAVSQLSDKTEYVYEASWSPDGSRIAYVSDQGGKDRLWVMNADGSDPRLLTPDLDVVRGAAWSPDGSRIAFTDAEADGAYAEVHVIDPGSGSDRKLTGPGDTASQVVWAPDGGRLYYLSGPSIVAVTPDGMSRETILTAPATINDYSVSSEGTQFAYSMGDTQDLDVYVSALDGSDPRCYRNPGKHEVFASWSPDGGSLLFSSFVPHQGPSRLYVFRTGDLRPCA
jgi:Tol biopolymer transport system component